MKQKKKRATHPPVDQGGRRGPEDAEPAPEQVAPTLPEATAKPLCVVGIGASAGGLEALSRLLEHLPVTTGMAFVVIAHLAPNETSIMHELLARTTRMPVLEAAQGMPVEPDHVYVI